VNAKKSGDRNIYPGDLLGGPEPHGDDAPVDPLGGDTVDAETERVIEEARKLFEQGEDTVDEE
jgi:hypothetical protein